MSNNAVVILMYPICATLANEVEGVSLRQLLVVLLVGASSSFLTPMSYQTNLMVFTPGKYKFSDYTSNEISNDHLRHMVGGRGIGSDQLDGVERIFNGEFPERPGALLDFLQNFGNKWNISLFHYRNIGSAYGNILIGIEDPNKNKSLLLKHLDKCGTVFKEESNNRAYLDFLK